MPAGSEGGASNYPKVYKSESAMSSWQREQGQVLLCSWISKQTERASELVAVAAGAKARCCFAAIQKGALHASLPILGAKNRNLCSDSFVKTQ